MKIFSTAESSHLPQRLFHQSVTTIDHPKKKKVTVSNPEKLTKKKNTQRVTRKEQFFFSVEAWGFEGGHTVFPPQNYDVISLTIHVRYILPTFG